MQRRLLVIVAGLVLVAIVAAGVLFVDSSALLARAQAYQGAVAAWVAVHPLLSPGIFLLCAVLGTLTPFPGGIFIMLIGGVLFGTIGGALAAAGATISAGLVCFSGRRLFADFIEAVLARRQAGTLEVLRADAFNYLLALRLLPGMPAWLTNLLPVPLPIALPTVLVATSLGILPISLIVATIGEDMAVLSAEHQPLSLHMLLGAHHLTPLIGLACLALLPPILKTVRRTSDKG
jgi:uncharacterized membrane protein YdjX (TVP38/TMEM64 family)